MIVIGLTGGIGTGKSIVAETLASLGARILNADQVGHEAYRPHTPVWEEVVGAFGQEILTDGEEIDRRKLGAIVFRDPQAREQLNRIMHPRMYHMMEERLARYRAEGAKVVVLEAALLFEANWTPLVDQIWVTTAPEAVVVQRLCQRNGIGEEQALARIRSQMPVAEKEKGADVIIDTDCSLEQVRQKVRALWQGLPVPAAPGVPRNTEDGRKSL